MRTALLALFLGALLLLAAPATWSHAQTTSASGGPGLVYQSVKDGDVVTEPLFDIQLCFKEPINIKDLDKGGDFAFQVTQPDGIGLGHRDIFQPDGYGIAIQPGNPVGTNLTGQWTFKYRVTTPDAQHATSGTITFTRRSQRLRPPARHTTAVRRVRGDSNGIARRKLADPGGQCIRNGIAGRLAHEERRAIRQFIADDPACFR